MCNRSLGGSDKSPKPRRRQRTRSRSREHGGMDKENEKGEDSEVAIEEEDDE